MYQVNLDVEREKFEVRLLLNMERIFVVKDGFIVRRKKKWLSDKCMFV